MKKLMTLIFTTSTFTVFAQNKIPLLKTSNSIKPDIEKVAGDYYNHFDNIKGDQTDETQNTIEYQSKILPKGALESSITQIKGLYNVYSWQAVMLNTDDFEKAVEKYEQIYHELNGAGFMMHDHKAWKFKGSYDTPDNARPFASSILEPDLDDKVLRRLKIEVALNYNISEWSVKVLVYEKENDADIRPAENSSQ